MFGGNPVLEALGDLVDNPVTSPVSTYTRTAPSTRPTLRPTTTSAGTRRACRGYAVWAVGARTLLLIVGSTHGLVAAVAPVGGAGFHLMEPASHSRDRPRRRTAAGSAEDVLRPSLQRVSFPCRPRRYERVLLPSRVYAASLRHACAYVAGKPRRRVGRCTSVRASSALESGCSAWHRRGGCWS